MSAVLSARVTGHRVFARAALSAESLYVGKASAGPVRKSCREATHKNPLTGTMFKFSDSDDVRDMSAGASLSQGQRGRERWAGVLGRAECAVVNLASQGRERE